MERRRIPTLTTNAEHLRFSSGIQQHKETVMPVINPHLLRAVATEFTSDLPSDATLRCYLMPAGPERNQCLQDAKEASAVAAVAAKLKFELMKSFLEVIWAGGGIDPLPLEKAVREAFSRGGQPAR
jgi:hypothetical protein